MSRSRFLGLFALPVLTAVVSASVAPSGPSAGPLAVGPLALGLVDVTSDFESAIELWNRDMKQESLDAMRRILASDPDPSEVYSAYLSADADVLTSFMSEGEEYTMVVRRFLERASLGRAELQNDASAIEEAVSEYMAADGALDAKRVIERIEAVHGEYAAPRLVNMLADDRSPDRLERAMMGLRGLGSRAVPALLAALDTDSEFQRRNVALALGSIGDRRAGPQLLAIAQIDESDSVREAAATSAARIGASGDPVTALTTLGDDYHNRRASALRDYEVSDVIWSWGGNQLESLQVPRSIYNNELSKNAYYAALAVDPASMDAAAGIARANVDIQSKLAALESAGQDVSALAESAAEGMLAVRSAGPAALDLALRWSVANGDAATGSRIAAILGEVASSPSEGLRAALAGGGASMAGEAAVAMAHIGIRSQSSVGDDVVQALADAAARRVVKVAIIIDGDAQRAQALVAALEGQGVLGQHAGSGVQGVVMLGQVSGVDAILVGDDLPDLTTDAVVQQIRLNPAYENTPTFLVTANEELADAYGDRIQGSFAGADGIEALQEVFDANLDDGRARADALSGSAAAALAALAQNGRGNVASATAGLLSAIDGRRDGVAIPALGALGSVGGNDSIDAILAVLADGDASDAVRVAAAGALGSIGARNAVGESTIEALRGMLGGDASIEVRSAAASALGGLSNIGGARADVMNAVRVRVGASE